jgi:GTP-binding protein EngB required for normal cell division
MVSQPESEIDWSLSAAQAEDITKLRNQYKCPHFSILIIGRANAGKTAILEKVCGVEKGTNPSSYMTRRVSWMKAQCTFSSYVPSRSKTGTW